VTITLTINPEIEEGLLARARARGMALQEYLQSIVEQQALQSGQNAAAPELVRREEAIRRMLEFGEKHHLSMGEPITRTSLHEGHRY
jgi:hypothetical protein